MSNIEKIINDAWEIKDKLVPKELEKQLLNQRQQTK